MFGFWIYFKTESIGFADKLDMTVRKKETNMTPKFLAWGMKGVAIN